MHTPRREKTYALLIPDLANTLLFDPPVEEGLVLYIDVREGEIKKYLFFLLPFWNLFFAL